jgi:hypothetical protein
MTDLGVDSTGPRSNDNALIVGTSQVYSGGTRQNLHNLSPVRSAGPCRWTHQRFQAWHGLVIA